MVKVIVPRDGVDTTQRDQFLHDLGTVIGIWSQFEMALEVIVHRRLRLIPADCSLVFSSLQFKSKESIACSLLERDGERDLSKKIQDIIAFAERNVLLHSPIGSEADFSQFAFWRRTTSRRHTVSRKDYTADTFHQRLIEFHQRVSNFFESAGLTEGAISDYARDAGFEGIDL